MELRKRKRVFYNARSRPKRIVSSASSSVPMGKITKVKPFQRPSFHSSKKDSDSSRNVQLYQDAQKELERLTKLQEKLYYENLRVPKWLGPSKNCRMLKLPDDLRIYKDISKDLSYLMNEICLQTAPPFAKRLPMPNVTAADDPNSIRKVARLYDIDIRDISDNLESTNCSPRLEIQSIGRKLEKPLLKGRDTSKRWPLKPKRKDGEQSNFANVPLFT